MRIQMQIAVAVARCPWCFSGISVPPTLIITLTLTLTRPKERNFNAWAKEVDDEGANLLLEVAES